MLILPICNNYSTSSTSGGLWHQRLFFLAWEIHFSCFVYGKMMQVQGELTTQNSCYKPSVPAVSEWDSILFIPYFFWWVLLVQLDFPARWGSKGNSGITWGKWIKNALSGSRSWFECAWFNENLEFLNQLWLHFSTEFQPGIGHTTGLVGPLLSPSSECFLGLIFPVLLY